jgi:predicted dehydrogenase
MKTNRYTRRHFVAVAGGTAVAAISAPRRAHSANETIGVGQIGLGVRGGDLIRQVCGSNKYEGIPGAKMVAVCDVYKPHLQKGVERSNNPSVRTYADYQELLADKDVNVVVIAVPDHWHCQMLLDACKAKKDVYIEKGWTRSIAEAKKMREAVKASGIVMQLGHQGRQHAAVIQARELIRQGVIGPVTYVRTGRLMNREKEHAIYRWWGGYTAYDVPDPKQVIADLDWKRWLGQTAPEPFNMEHFWHWRCYWKYGTTVMGDLMSHEMDFVQAVLGHGIPESCMCAAMISLLNDGREAPDTLNAVFNYKADANNPAHQATFGTTMNTALPPQPPEFRGKDAYLLTNGIAQDVNNFEVFGEPDSGRYPQGDRGKPFLAFDPKKTPEQPSHMQDFFNCVRSRKAPKCNVDEAFIEAATFIMATESLMKERKVKWDAGKEEIV